MEQNAAGKTLGTEADFSIFKIIEENGVKLKYLCELAGLVYNNVTTQRSKGRILLSTAKALKAAFAKHIALSMASLNKLGDGY